MQSPIYGLRNRTVNSKLPSVRDNFLQPSSSSPCHQTSVATPTTFQRPSTTVAVGTSVSHVFYHSQPSLKFSTDDVSLWFTRFEAKYHNSNLDDQQLYFELINCLNDYQLQKVSALSRHPPSYQSLKSALLQAFDLSPLQRIQNLHSAPQLGDRKPSELLSHLRLLLKQDDLVNETAKALLLQAFMERMPSTIRQILSAFVSESLDDIASKADALVLNDRQYSALQRHNDSPDTLFPVVSKLAAQVEKLSLQVESLTLKPNHYKPTPSTFFSPSPNRHTFPDYSQSAKHPSTSSKTSRNSIINGKCFYHTYYPNSPHSCAPGCKYFSGSLNSQPGTSM